MLFKSLSESDKSLDDALRVLLVKEGMDEVRFRKLDEASKKQIGNDVVDSLIGAIKGKLKDVDFSAVEASKGDITKISGYKDLEGSINLLMSMKSKAANAPEEIGIVSEALNNLKANTHAFQEGFRENSELVVLLYNTVATAVIRATGILIATTVSYIKDSMGQYAPKLQAEKAKFGKDVDLHFSNLKKFNSYARTGRLKSFFDASLAGEHLAGAAMGAGVIAVIVLLVWLIREFVYLYFAARTNISIYLKTLSDFLQMNASTLNTKDMKQTREKQEALAKRLSDMSEKIKVDQVTSNKRAKEELQTENNQANFETLSGNPNFL